MTTSSPIRRRSYLWWLAAFFGMVLLCGITAACCWAYIAYQQIQPIYALRDEWQAIRATDDPVGGEELDEFYRCSSDRADRTEEVLAALANFSVHRNGPETEQLFALSNLEKASPPHSPEAWGGLVEAVQLVGKNSDSLEQLQAALDIPGDVRFPTDFAQGITLRMPAPHLYRITNARMLLGLRSLCHYYLGDSVRATDDVIRLIRLHEVLRIEPFSVAQEMRSTIWSYARTYVKFLLTDPNFPAVEIRRLQVAIAATEFEGMYRRAAIGERAILHESFRLNLKELIEENPRDHKPPPVYEAFPQHCRATLRHYTLHVEAERLPMPARVIAAATAHSQVKAELNSDKDKPKLQRNAVSSLLYQPFYLILELEIGAEVERRALVAVCAAEIYRRERREVAASLSQLVPEFLSEIPLDPIDGQPLRYVCDDSRYCVYSIGVNQIDDGGQVKHQPKVRYLDFGIEVLLSQAAGKK